MFELQDLCFRYPGREALFEGLSKHFPQDQRILLRGANGSGKSTLLKLLCKKLEPDRGNILRSTNSLFYLPQDSDRRILGISLEDDLSIWQMTGLDPAEVMKHPLLKGFGPGLRNLALRELSKGAKQAYLLSVALCVGHYLVLDEPFSALDAERAEILGSYLRGQKAWLLVSHSQMDLDADIVFDLEGGKLL